MEAPSKPSNLLPHPTCGPKHNTICPTCCTQTASLDCASFASCPSFPALLSLAGERPVPPCSPSEHTQSGVPRHTHTRRRRATSCHGGRTRRTRSPTPLALPLVRRRRSLFISIHRTQPWQAALAALCSARRDQQQQGAHAVPGVNAVCAAGEGERGGRGGGSGGALPINLSPLSLSSFFSCSD